MKKLNMGLSVVFIGIISQASAAFASDSVILMTSCSRVAAVYAAQTAEDSVQADSDIIDSVDNCLSDMNSLRKVSKMAYQISVSCSGGQAMTYKVLVKKTRGLCEAYDASLISE